jgi:hypothetical protein
MIWEAMVLQDNGILDAIQAEIDVQFTLEIDDGENLILNTT